MGEVKTIGLYLANCVEYPAIIAGALHAGLVITPLNPAYTPSEARIYNVYSSERGYSRGNFHLFTNFVLMRLMGSGLVHASHIYKPYKIEAAMNVSAFISRVNKNGRKKI